jgi:hypothetical protein
MPKRKAVDQLIAGLPSVSELRRRLAANIKERHFLRSLLHLAEKREAAEQAKRDIEMLRAVQNGGAGEESRRFNLAAHMSAVL